MSAGQGRAEPDADVLSKGVLAFGQGQAARAGWRTASGLTARYAVVPHSAPMRPLLSLIESWKLPEPSVLISITGSAQLSMDPSLQQFVQEGLTSLARQHKVWMFTGGMDCGVMALGGAAARSAQIGNAVTTPCIGVAPWRKTTAREQLHRDESLRGGLFGPQAHKKAGRSFYGSIRRFSASRPSTTLPKGRERPVAYAKGLESTKDSKLLNSSHTHFVLVDDGKEEWGGEIALRAELESAIAQVHRVPIVLIVLEGGPNTYTAVCSAVTRGQMAVLLKDSGGAAQTIAECVEPLLQIREELAQDADGLRQAVERRCTEFESTFSEFNRVMMEGQRARALIALRTIASHLDQLAIISRSSLNSVGPSFDHGLLATFVQPFQLSEATDVRSRREKWLAGKLASVGGHMIAALSALDQFGKVDRASFTHGFELTRGRASKRMTTQEDVDMRETSILGRDSMRKDSVDQRDRETVFPLYNYQLRIVPTRLEVSLIRQLEIGDSAHVPTDRYKVTGPFSAVALLSKHFNQSDILGKRSPTVNVTLQGGAKEAAGIPQAATMYCFLYPMEALRPFQRELLSECFEYWLFILLYGGFVYLDQAGNQLACNALESIYENSAPTKGPQMYLSFDGPHEPNERAMAALQNSERMANVTVSSLRRLGYDKFGFVSPAELLAGEPLDLGYSRKTMRSSKSVQSVRFSAGLKRQPTTEPTSPSLRMQGSFDKSQDPLSRKGSASPIWPVSQHSSSRASSAATERSERDLREPSQAEQIVSILPASFVYELKDGKHVYYKLNMNLATKTSNEADKLAWGYSALKAVSLLRANALLRPKRTAARKQGIKFPIDPYDILVREIRRTANERVVISAGEFLAAVLRETIAGGAYTHLEEQTLRQVEDAYYALVDAGRPASGGNPALPVEQKWAQQHVLCLTPPTVFNLMVKQGRIIGSVAAASAASAASEEAGHGLQSAPMLVDTTAKDGGFAEWFTWYVLVDVDETESRKVIALSEKDRRDMEAAERRRRDEEAQHSYGFWFVTRAFVLGCDAPPPRFQQLQKKHPGALVYKLIRLEDLGKHVPSSKATAAYNNILSVSHRWERPDCPDTGQQLLEIQRHLREHEEIQYVFYDYWCMAQAPRSSPKDNFEFQSMLHHMNWVYLCTRVLILLDLSYLGRFWTQFEAWLSMQSIEQHRGLVPASKWMRRCTIVPIHNANHRVVEQLTNMWASKTPQQAHEILSGEDIELTNKTDKTLQLPKMLKINESVDDIFGRQLIMPARALSV